MTSLHRKDRREFQRYRTNLVAELITETKDTVSCTLMDISASGASVLCEPIAEDVVVSLYLEDFGEIEALRLRSIAGVERLLFRNTDFRRHQLIRFLATLVDAGAAIPAGHRRQDSYPCLSLEPHNRPTDADEALTFRVMQAIHLISQWNVPSGNLPGNVVLFPGRFRPNISAEPPPDESA